MAVAVESFIFALLVCSLTSAQECLRKDIDYENIQKSGLSQTYESGDNVRVNCETGYTGFLKLSCVKGEWRKDGGRECKKRPCGHPGDTPNGDFKLLGETEFVFGATVEYTCRPGYIMASRVNKRNCRSQGWDNAVPVCEVVKCPTIQTSGDVIATGNTEEASFDDVIHFECASLQLMLDGPQDIHCTEQGTWSAPVPKCIEIRCTPPQILHGFITNHKMEYKENEQLRYTCENKYRPRHGIPRCLRTGWSITPECEEITCLLGPLTPGIKSRMPEGKNVFRVGESVEITCSETFWLFREKLTKQTIRCTDSGEWEHPTVCEEIACEVPYDEEHLYYRPYNYFGGDRRLGVRKSYQCESGYRKGAEKATCTKNGWVPKPLCTEIVCPKLTIENANPLEKLQDTYKPGVHVSYHCKHEPESRRFYITCNRRGEWDNKEWFLRHCIQRTTCSKPEAIDNGIIKEPPWVEDQYERGSTVEYKCSEGYVFENENSARCVGPHWTYPKCILNTCASHKLDNGLLHYVPDSSRAYYSCNEGYKTTENTWWGETSCLQGSLVPKPQCISENECGRFPNIPHGKRISAGSFTLECDLGYKADTSSITCDKGQWKIPECLTGGSCGIPPRVKNAIIDSYTQESHQTQVTYKCREHFEPTKRPEIICIKKWDPVPTCKLSSSACLNPKRDITNGTVVKPEQIREYYGGDARVEYKCSEGFMFEEDSFARCVEKNWVYPKCIIKQSEKRDPDPAERLEPEAEGEEKTELDKPVTISPASAGQGRTEEKELATTEHCSQPPSIPDAVLDFKYRYEDGERLRLDCPAYYVQEGDQYLTCRGGGWIGKGKCLKPCTVDVQVLDNNKIQLVRGGRQKIYSPHGYYISFVCKGRLTFAKDSVGYRQLCTDGHIALPVCE